MKKLALALLIAAGGSSALGVAAYARPGDPHGERRGPMMPFEAVLRPEQRQQLFAIVKADRSKLEALHKRLHAAREALIQKLLSPDKSVDVSKEVAELKAAQAAMIDERVSIALQARKLLSAGQLRDAAEFHSKLQELHRQESALLEQMSRSGNGATGQPEQKSVVPQSKQK